MVILPAQVIRKLNIIRPFEERTVSAGKTYGLSSAGYDIRIGQETDLFDGFALASTLEHFEMPNDVMGFVCDKSSWARQGIFVQNTVIEPGWYGYLTLEITAIGDARQTLLAKGMAIAQIVFMRLEEPTEQPYAGKYQNQSDHPVESIYETIPRTKTNR